MKSKFDLKHGIGKITPESGDDLWVLDSILQEGDFITAKTPRSQDIIRDGKKVRGKKKLVLLKIQLEKKELDGVLKLRGKIVAGPDDVDRGYHTIEARPQDFLTVERNWKSWEVDKVKKARNRTEPVLVLILDDTDCDFYMIKGKANHLLHIDGPGSGKKVIGKGRKKYFEGIIDVLERRGDKNIVIAGPGFTREDLVKELKGREIGKIVLEGCSHTGINGLQEVLKRKVLDKVIKNSRLTEETEIIEKFLGEIAKKGKVTYGKGEVRKAVESGAVEVLLMSENLVRKNEQLLEQAEKIKAKIMIVSPESESGKKFLGLGGIGAFLRYRVE